MMVYKPLKFPLKRTSIAKKPSLMLTVSRKNSFFCGENGCSVVNKHLITWMITSRLSRCPHKSEMHFRTCPPCCETTSSKSFPFKHQLITVTACSPTVGMTPTNRIPLQLQPIIKVIFSTDDKRKTFLMWADDWAWNLIHEPPHQDCQKTLQTSQSFWWYFIICTQPKLVSTWLTSCCVVGRRDSYLAKGLPNVWG